MTRSRLLSTTLAAAMCVTLAAALTQTASAADIETRTQIVSLHGLDLTSPADQSILRHRIELAAKDVCDRPDPRDLSAGRSYETCRRHALADASAQADTKIAAAVAKSRFAAAGNASKPQGAN